MPAEVRASGSFYVMRALVFIHGYPLDATAFAEVVPRIEHGVKVLTPDLLGFGTSPWPPGGDLSMEAQADHVISLMEQEGVARATVIGLSMGGYVALAMLERAPRFIEGLALIGSKPDPDDEAGRAKRDAQAAAVVAEGRSSLVAPMTGALLADDADLVTRARLRTMIEQTPLETYVGALEGMRDRVDRSEVLQGFEGPVTVQVGTDDPLVSVDRAHEIAASCRDATVDVVDGIGHLVPMEAPAATAAMCNALVARSNG